MKQPMQRVRIIALLVAALLLLVGCHLLPVTISPAESEESTLVVFFIDVGQADSTLILCDDAAMLIDGGNAADSSLIYTFLKDLGVSHLSYIVASHAHEDHVGGLAGALNYATVDVALCPVTEYDSRAFRSFVRYLEDQDVSITVPSHGDTYQLGSAEVKVVGPINPTSAANNTSLILRLTYGDTNFLFTGDAERVAELDVIEAGYELSATVLKVGHHGSESSTTYPFLREVMPEYAVISCGKGNPYGHPHESVLSRLRDADTTVFRTDVHGTVVFESDGQSISFSVERNAMVAANAKVQTGQALHYIGNTNSMKFHRSDCSGLPVYANRLHFDSRDEAIAGGYTSCGICNP